MNAVLTYLVPFALSLGLAGAIRVFAGPERGARAAGFAVIISFVAAWLFFLDVDPLGRGDFARIGHIAFGAALAGVLLDVFAARRIWFYTALGVLTLGSAWASLNGGLRPHGAHDALFLATVVGTAAVASLVLLRFDSARERGSVTPVLLTVAAVGLGVMAWIVGDLDLARTGGMLAAAIVGFIVLQALVPLSIGATVTLGAGSAVLAMVWVLANHADARLGLLLAPLILFAEGTAGRIPLPKARISVFLAPFVLASIAALPLILAIIVVYVTAHA
jgi:hypothetical protein